MIELQVKNLKKTYNSQVALDNISYTFKPGIYGLLGPNGAGKSTLMNILVGNLKRNSGEINFNGKDIDGLGRNYRQKIGYMPQQQGVYKSFTLKRFLCYMATLKGIPSEEIPDEVDYVVSLVNLKDKLYSKMGALSGGMKQRAMIAQALLGSPNILIFDEPTAGLDPMERIRIRNMISKIAADKIVIIATHVVTDIEFIANYIIILKKGNIIIADTPVNLSKGLSKKVYEVNIKESELDYYTREYRISNLQRTDEGIRLRLILDDKHQMENNMADEVVATLDDVYLYYFEEEILF
jgi:ABC-type multidrug transport system ATPase subunit